EALHLEALQFGSASEVFLTFGSANLTLDLWHSGDLVSYLRVRAGPGLEFDAIRKFTSVKPEVALEGDWTLDRDGFNHAHLQVAGEKLYLDPDVDGRVNNPERLRIRAGFERVLLAFNDYPLSFVIDGKATWRDDLTEVAPG